MSIYKFLFFEIFMYKNILFLCLSIFAISSCASVVKDQAKKKAKTMGLSMASLKEGEACKYMGFIGDNSVSKAKANGKISLMYFSLTDGNFARKCTYAYGR